MDYVQWPQKMLRADLQLRVWLSLSESQNPHMSIVFKQARRLDKDAQYGKILGNLLQI